jgi:hypothetical protein
MSLLDLSNVKQSILTFQRVSRRNKTIYHANITEKDAWIHSMACYYLINAEEEEWEALEQCVSSYETDLIWCYQDGIDKNTERLKEILGDRFIDYEDDDKPEQNLERDLKLDRELFLLSFRSKL